MESFKTKKAIKQLKALEEIINYDSGREIKRLAAEGWNENWKVLIATILSAQNRDSKTIPVSEKLFEKFNSIKNLGNAPLKDIKRIIKTINYYKTKAKNVKETAKIINKKYKGKIPENVEELITLPGVGRKTANVYLAVALKKEAIGVDTHVSRISRKLGWTKSEKREEVEKELEKLFPKKYWNSINWILVRFGQNFRSQEDEILRKITIA